MGCVPQTSHFLVLFFFFFLIENKAKSILNVHCSLEMKDSSVLLCTHGRRHAGTLMWSSWI